MTTFLKNFTKNVRTRMIFFIISDILLISFSIFLAFFLRFEGLIPSRFLIIIPRFIFLTLFFSIPIFYFLKLYSFSWSYISTEELISLIKGTSLSFLFLGATLYLSRDFHLFTGFPRSTFFISYFLIILFCGGIRFSKRLFFEIFRNEIKQKERTLIVGAGDAGEQILRSIFSSKESNFLPIGFIDDDLDKRGMLIHRMKVLGGIKDIPKIIEKEKAGVMIIALPSVGSKIIKQAVELGRMSGLKKIKIIPPLAEIIGGEVDVGKLKEVQVDDLLGREPVALDAKLIKNFIYNKKILITGAAGSIGSELSRQVLKFRPSELFILDRDETGIFNITNELNYKFPRLKIIPVIADIQDKEKIDKIFNQFRPDIIFHAAAYKHVPLMESHPDEAVKNNVFGTRAMVEAALKYGVSKFIFISTDKSVNPTSIMGATKRLGEMFCQNFNQLSFSGKLKTKFISVRFGNVLDSRGSVIPVFREQIKKGGPVEVTHPEMKRYFMLISEACLLVMEAGAMGQGGEVFVLDMGKPIKILDLAKEMIKLSGFEPDKDIPIVFPGPRPGEKIFEEILTTEEGTLATKHKKIFIAKISPPESNKIEIYFNELKKKISKGNSQEIVDILKKMVPTYSPRNN